MRKTFLLFGVLALVGVLFVACSDQQDLTSPEDAAFGKKAPTDCVLANASAIRILIGELFDGKKDVKAATEMFDNIERKVCKENYEGATNTAYDFYVMTYGQLPDKLGSDTPYEDAAELVSMVFAFASNGTAPSIPPGAFQPTGGVGVFDPAVGGTIYTNNFQAALKADPNQFPGTDPVVIVLTRLPDPDSEVGSEGVIPGYLAFPLAYNIEVNRPPVIVPPDPGVLVALCVVTDYLPDGVFDQLVIGHKTGPETGETWTPAIKYGELSELLPDLYCGDAVADPPASALAAAEMAPEWLKFAGRLLEPIADRMLDVQPLDAYFAGTGLGGRGNSVSPFAAVLDDQGNRFYTLDVTGSGDGIGSVNIFVGSGNEPDTYSCGYSPEVGMTSVESEPPEDCNLLLPADEDVELQAHSNNGTSLGAWVGCDAAEGSFCSLTMDGNRNPSISFNPSEFTLSLNVTGDGVVTGTVHTVPPQPVNCAGTTAAPALCEYSGIGYLTGVELTGTPAGDNDRVTWSGVECDWSGGVVGDGDYCSFDMTEDYSQAVQFYETPQ